LEGTSGAVHYATTLNQRAGNRRWRRNALLGIHPAALAYFSSNGVDHGCLRRHSNCWRRCITNWARYPPPWAD